MSTQNKQYLLMLNRMPGIGPATIYKLLKRWPDLAELFCLSQAELIGHGLSVELARILTRCNRHAVDLDWHWASAPDCRLLTWGEADYPSLLQEIANPPPVLYARGQFNSLSSPLLAIVGTRNPTISGSQIAKQWSTELAGHGFSLVSGLARGIDGQVHAGALHASGRTIAVLGTGIDCIYPRQHAKLAERIIESGLLLSEFPLKTPPIAGHFPRRNRIISGLSVATLVIEAAVKSGSLVTARYALEQNREVFAVPGSIHNPQTRGCHHLLQQGAVLATSVQDILDELNLQGGMNKILRLPELCNADERRGLMQYMSDKLHTVDQLVLCSGWSLDAVIRELTELELAGLVQTIPGGYMRCRV